jgi:Mce-associated membrane protein
VQHRAAEQDRARDVAVLDDTRSAIATLLTIDPAEPQQFLDEALAVTSGEQHQRLVDARPQVLELVGQLQAPNTGQVLAAGITGDVDDDTARVYVVAEGTNPALLGAGAGQNRVALVVTMKADDGRWKIDRTQLQ